MLLVRFSEAHAMLACLWGAGLLDDSWPQIRRLQRMKIQCCAESKANRLLHSAALHHLATYYEGVKSSR